MVIETNMFDSEEVVYDCTVFTMNDAVHYEVWYPWTKHLIVADPTCVTGEHKHCNVQILRNSVNGNISYGWMEV